MENNLSRLGSEFVPLRVTFEESPRIGPVDVIERATTIGPRANDLSTSIHVFEPKRVTLEEYRRLCQADAAEQAAKAVQSETLELRQQAGYYKSLWERGKQRISELETELASAKAQLKAREQQLFGQKSEKKSESASSPASPVTSASPLPDSPKRPRGQQRGRPGPKRRDHSHLPTVEIPLELPVEQQLCSCCGLPFAAFPGTEDSEVLEIEVKAHRRIYRRQRYRPSCSCAVHPGIVTAPAAPRVIPKSNLGVSIWVEILLDKFHFYRPTYRLLHDWQTRGLNLSQGSVTGGMQRLSPLFEPIYKALIEHNQQQEHWHADETRWMVFANVTGKIGHRWMMWVFLSKEAVAFVLDQGRAHDVPEEHFDEIEQGILSVDRYSAYKAMKQVKEGKIVLAFCWAHVRRDFLEVARSWPEQEKWGLDWVERIGQLYKDNQDRQKEQVGTATYADKDRQLRERVAEMEEERKKELGEEKIHPARKKVLLSLEAHWKGLTVFVAHPEVPMDNNKAERTLRGLVVCRKNSRGSAAEWSGQLTAMLFSVFETLKVWKINPRVWLNEYLEECAKAGGKPPEDWEKHLPWKMSEEKRKEWSMGKEKKPEESQ